MSGRHPFIDRIKELLGTLVEDDMLNPNLLPTIYYLNYARSCIRPPMSYFDNSFYTIEEIALAGHTEAIRWAGALLNTLDLHPITLILLAGPQIASLTSWAVSTMSPQLMMLEQRMPGIHDDLFRGLNPHAGPATGAGDAPPDPLHDS
jgi:hypothetical protein